MIVKTDSETNATSSGIIIPEAEHQATPVVGRVIGVGPDSKYKEGQVVFFRRYTIDELKFDDTESEKGEIIVHLLEDDDIVATLDENESV